MTRDELYGYIQRPETLGANTLPELQTLVEAYPWCATFVYLYLYNLALLKDLRYSAELRRLAIFLPDRKRLYMLVEQQVAPLSTTEATTAVNTEDPFALIDNFLSEAKAQGEDLPQELQLGRGADRNDYFAYDSTPTVGTEVSNETALLQAIGQEPDETPTESDSPSPEDSSLDEALFTETLARIYIKQGRYDKALRIIRTISLKYPKKNRFFAQQIRFLERLILNKEATKTE